MVQSPFSMCWSSRRGQYPPRMQVLLDKTRWFLAEMIRDMDRYGLVRKYGTAPRCAMCFLGECRWFSGGMGMVVSPIVKAIASQDLMVNKRGKIASWLQVVSNSSDVVYHVYPSWGSFIAYAHSIPSWLMGQWDGLFLGLPLG